jgi:outer membrane protein assembly factor BamD (BamD/ComL family)
MRLSFLLVWPLAASAVLRGQEPLIRPIPFASAPAAPSPGEDAVTALAARQAQELGLPGLAAQLYRGLLAQSGAGPASRDELGLALATALLDDNRPAEAEQALRGVGAQGSAWHLRQALTLAQERKLPEARLELAAVKPGELAAADQPWHFFLQGELAGAAGDLAGQRQFFQQAEARAGTGLERARFYLAGQEVQMRLGQVSEDAAEQTRKNAENFRGTPVGYDAWRYYAVMLNALGRRSDAVSALNGELLLLPAREREYADDFRLLIGMIAGAADGAGRRALTELLAGAARTDLARARERAALELLAEASRTDPARTRFRGELDQLLAAPAPHPIQEDLLLYRASWALDDAESNPARAREDYVQAEADADLLLQRFPGSPLKIYALGVQMRVDWAQARYRAAADKAATIRSDPAAGEARATLGVLRAEALFRAGGLSVGAADKVDFGNAAEAYGAALRERPAGIPAGYLMFQQVQSQVAAGSLAAAEQTLDRLADDPAFDAEDRWRAEWNLARALEAAGSVDAAYARVGGLLGAGALPAGLPAELRARMRWLQARLSLDAGKPAETRQLAEALGRALDGLAPGPRAAIARSAELLLAQADFALGEDTAALAALERLRGDFPRTDEAADSYLIEAEHYAARDDIVRAQNVLIHFVDDKDYSRSTYAPYALYQVALWSEQLGQRKDFLYARELLEQLVTRYPASDRVFYARLKEGDLLRKLNDFPAAQQVYELLRNQFPQRDDIVYVLLALAECHDAESTADPTHAETAEELFEDVRDRPGAPVDARTEAGYNLGFLLHRRGDDRRAIQVWWRDVISAFLLDPAARAHLGVKGRSWMARTILALGELYAGQNQPGLAKGVLQLIPNSGLPGAELAQQRLASLDAPAPRP